MLKNNSWKRLIFRTWTLFFLGGKILESYSFWEKRTLRWKRLSDSDFHSRVVVVSTGNFREQLSRVLNSNAFAHGEKLRECLYACVVRTIRMSEWTSERRERERERKGERKRKRGKMKRRWGKTERVFCCAKCHFSSRADECSFFFFFLFFGPI